MTTDAPYHGHFKGRDHCFAVRVYFEDTDFSGVVYHARYLNFMERARSDMLSCAGIGQQEVYAADGGVYAVARMTLNFRKPARFDDALLIVSTVERIRAADVVIHQRVMLNGEHLVAAEVLAAFTRNGRAARQPADWIAAFTRLLPEGTP